MTYSQKFKDSNRYWWKVSLTATGAVDYDDGDFDLQWKWEIESEEEDIKSYWTGVIFGQYDEVPPLKEVLREWQKTVNRICFDALKSPCWEKDEKHSQL